MLRIASAILEKSPSNGARTLRNASTSVENITRRAPERCESHLRASKNLARTAPEHCYSHVRSLKNLPRTAPQHRESHLRTLKKLACAPPEHLGSHLRTSNNLAPTAPERRPNVANRICEHGKSRPNGARKLFAGPRAIARWSFRELENPINLRARIPVRFSDRKIGRRVELRKVAVVRYPSQQ